MNATIRLISSLLMTTLLMGVVVGGTSTGCNRKRAPGAVRYAATAEENYELGLQELKEKDWVAASKYFALVKARYPYSKLATAAQLRLADAEFGAQEYMRSIDSYKLFMRFHPQHEEVLDGYVSFRIGAAYAKMLPKNVWILPPVAEKDQTPNEEARSELTKFMKNYPDSTYRPEAEKLLFRANRKLAEHEWYAANFYWRKKKYMGAVFRLKKITDELTGSGYDERAYLMLGKAYVKSDLPDKARVAWQTLVEKYPKSKEAQEAGAYLK